MLKKQVCNVFKTLPYTAGFGPITAINTSVSDGSFSNDLFILSLFQQNLCNNSGKIPDYVMLRMESSSSNQRLVTFRI
jgi:hypothetical protein